MKSKKERLWLSSEKHICSYFRLPYVICNGHMTYDILQKYDICMKIISYDRKKAAETKIVIVPQRQMISKIHMSYVTDV